MKTDSQAHASSQMLLDDLMLSVKEDDHSPRLIIEDVDDKAEQVHVKIAVTKDPVPLKITEGSYHQELSAVNKKRPEFSNKGLANTQEASEKSEVKIDLEKLGQFKDVKRVE